MKASNLSKRGALRSAALCAVVLAAFLAGRAMAGGIPATAALTYSGTLEDANGAPISGSHNIEVRLWDVATGGTSALCTTDTQTVDVTNGRFSLTLPDDCTNAARTNADLWADVRVDSESLGRAKLGAVPYAIEAAHAVAADGATNADHAVNTDHATNADSATNAGHATASDTATAANGALDTRIAAIETKPTLAQLHYDQLVAGDDPNVGGFASLCVNSPSLVNCTVGANRKCLYLGYSAGWFVGESADGTYRTIVCIK